MTLKLETARLDLRMFELSDAAAVQQLAGSQEVARTTLAIPHAAAMTNNPASSKVMVKIGMKPEGVYRQHVLKWGHYEDLALYGMVRSEYLERYKP
ncbi:GNAT family N-acetyltransferase [Paenibacillus oceani]|uniref:GNAT family N-acetyltransferase n=1 Tax=Paenibacillus oceani TaxID=2772510 RepID=A0A927CAP3_9BACL|nr:GNAT family protein [Paenibacillus oceani]MBD2864195.1 GNAT family N-acetyltransferase [Paenibacillus oceani]